MASATSLIERARIDSREFYADPHPTLAMLRREAPVHWYEPGEFWVLTRYEDIRYVNSHPELFSSESGFTLTDNVFPDQVADLLPPESRARLERGELTRAQLRREVAQIRRRAIAPDGEIPSDSITVIDPPRHTRLRKFVSKAFTPRMVAHYHDEIEEIIFRALDRIQPGETVDFVKQVSVPIPAEVIAVFLGVPPEDRAQFVRWSDDVALTFDEGDRDAEARLRRSAADMYAYVRDRLRLRRTEPADDMLTALIEAEIDGDRMSESEMVAFANTFLFAGNETTRHVISGIAKLLAEHPDQRQLLIDRPDLIPTAMDEFFRYVSPVWGLLRTATERTEIAGRTIEAGDLVYVMYSSANRDETIWEDADRFDVTRLPSPPHMGFGWGAHRCLGSNLARLEARMTLERLLERFPDFELAGDPVRLNSATFNGIVSLPMLMK